MGPSPLQMTSVQKRVDTERLIVGGADPSAAVSDEMEAGFATEVHTRRAVVLVQSVEVPEEVAAWVAGQERPPTYLWLSTFTCVFCFSPAGLVAMCCAARASDMLSRLDFRGARKASDCAKAWSVVSMLLGVIITYWLWGWMFNS